MACDVRLIASGSQAQQRAAEFLPLAEGAANKYGVPLSLIVAVIRTESNWDPNALSGAGAVGLMQLMPSTGSGLAAQLGIAPYTPTNPAQNVELGVYLLSRLKRRWASWDLAVMAYFAGGGNIKNKQDAGEDFPGSWVRYVEAVGGRELIAANACGLSPVMTGGSSPSPSPRPTRPTTPTTSSTTGSAEGALLLAFIAWAATR